MEIEKLIERLESWNEQHLSVVCGNGHFACDYLCENEDCIVVRAATASSTLQAENEKLKAQVPRWISVEERLPKPELKDQQRGFYLVTLSNGVVKELMYEFRHYDNMMFDVGWHDTAFPVTHWMPLPKAPKEEKE